jgi:DNA-binding transcriptional regulator YdaS (Cro superfamily)
VLKDVVNELGRRLEYKVTNGRYQGTTNAVGFDGIWVSPELSAVIVEVKTTDAYRISLDTIARYRDKLESDGIVAPPASILIVVGREDTGELEAQVRGSRHAWDMRLISIDALLALVRIKESTESGVSGAKIRSVLVPMEYTRLDALVDVMFTTTKDVEAAADSEKPPAAVEVEEGESSGWEFTPQHVIQSNRDAIIRALGVRDSKKLIKRSRALYWDAEHGYRVVCTVSKRYTKQGVTRYRYAYHPGWDEFLGEGEDGWVALGRVGLSEAFVLPVDVMRQALPQLNTTVTPDGKPLLAREVGRATSGRVCAAAN